MTVKRFGVSLEENVLKKLDDFILKEGFPSRSQGIKFLIEENKIAKDSYDDEKEIAGAIVLVYDHHKRNIEKISNEIQHELNHLILAVQHIHLDHNNCLESIAVKGNSKDVHRLSKQLLALKGLKHGKLVISSSE